MNILYKFDDWVYEIEVINNYPFTDSRAKFATVIREQFVPTMLGKLLGCQDKIVSYIKNNTVNWYECPSGKLLGIAKQVELDDKLKEMKKGMNNQ